MSAVAAGDDGAVEVTVFSEDRNPDTREAARLLVEKALNQAAWDRPDLRFRVVEHRGNGREPFVANLWRGKKSAGAYQQRVAATRALIDAVLPGARPRAAVPLVDADVPWGARSLGCANRAAWTGGLLRGVRAGLGDRAQQARGLHLMMPHVMLEYWLYLAAGGPPGAPGGAWDEVRDLKALDPRADRENLDLAKRFDATAHGPRSPSWRRFAARLRGWVRRLPHCPPGAPHAP